MTEKLSDVVNKIKSNIASGPKKDYATAQLDYDKMFDDHANLICPDFKSNKSIEEIKLHFLHIVQRKSKKGVFVFGDVGVGKSTIFKIFQSMGKSLYQEYGSTALWFSSCTAPWLVDEKMESVSPGYSGNFDLERYYTGKLYIDDLGMESLCFNSYELMTKLLFQRHRNEAITFVSSNLTPKDILKRYGPQVFDRMSEMFRIVKWEGKSLRNEK